MWAVLFSDGALTLKDLAQVKDEQWVPVACVRPKGSKADGTILLFHGQDIAYKFVRRNMNGKDWLKGGVHLGDVDVENIRKRFAVEELSFPKRYDSHPEFEIGCEVIELESSPEIMYKRVTI